MSVVVITPPVSIVSLELARQHLRLDPNDDDILIEAYINAAQGMIDGPGGWLGRCIGQQTLELRMDGFTTPIWAWNYDTSGIFWGAQDNYANLSAAWPSSRVELPFPPLINVTSVTYEDGQGQVQTLPSSAYLASDEGLDTAYGTTFPSGRWEAGAVRIRYQAGYVSTPGPILAALLLMVGDLYQNRETTVTGRSVGAVTVPMSTTVEALLGPYRVYT